MSRSCPALSEPCASLDRAIKRGRFSYLEVLDAERTLFELREQSLEALEAYHAALSEIERLTGEAVSTAKP